MSFCLCWGLTSQSTIFQSCRDGATASWVINQYFRGVKCHAQGHNTAAVGFEPPTSRSGVRHSTTEPPHSLVQWVHGLCPVGPWTMSCQPMNIVQSAWIHRLCPECSWTISQGLTGLTRLCPWTHWTLSRLSTESMVNVHWVHGKRPGSSLSPWTLQTGQDKLQGLLIRSLDRHYVLS